MNEFICGYRINFTEGEPEFQVLQRGTKEECDRVLELVPAVAYSGPREVVDAYAFVVEADDPPRPTMTPEQWEQFDLRR